MVVVYFLIAFVLFMLGWFTIDYIRDIPIEGPDGYQVGLRTGRRVMDPPSRKQAWKALEDTHAAECLAALTLADVKYLKAWGWEPDSGLELRILAAERDRIEKQILQDAQDARTKREEERAKEKAARAAAARAAGKPTQDELAAEADTRVQRGDILYRSAATSYRIEQEQAAAEERARLSLEHYLGLNAYSIRTMDSREETVITADGITVRRIYDS